MAKDEFKNLGFPDATDSAPPRNAGNPPPEKGTKGELQW
jgi:hypothetical protein